MKVQENGILLEKDDTEELLYVLEKVEEILLDHSVEKGVSGYSAWESSIRSKCTHLISKLERRL